MILEYLNVVKAKIGELDGKLEKANKEGEYFKRKSEESEKLNNELRDKE